LGISYKDAGVDIEAGAFAVDAIKEAVQETYTDEVIGTLGGFGGLFSAKALKQMDEPILVSGTDGVGTKLDLARRTRKFKTVGIDLVAMCANDIVTCGAKPLFFLDYIAVGKLKPRTISVVVEGIANGCKQAGCALIGGETAEHPGLMKDTDIDLSGVCVGVVDRAKMIGPEKVMEGDVIIGLASSGFHSNGYSLVRRAFTDKLSDNELNTKLLENGKFWADALLEPTKVYVEPLLGALQAGLPIHAAAHITGGGITHNLNRVLPAGLNALVTLDSWVIPPVIRELAHYTGLDIYELLATFNMGIGMALIVPPSAAAAVTKHFQLPGSQTKDRHGGVFTIGTIVKAEAADKPGIVMYVKS
jgi:phosphoribosylformylglycinamidine cyclo-ligase